MRELSDAAIGHQVDALEAFESRGGSVEHWIESKGFSQADVTAILAELERRDGDDVDETSTLPDRRDQRKPA